MLIEFSVENYRSIKDRVVLSMVAANLKSQDENLDRDNVIPVSKKLSLLRSVALYGANASGKSNILKAWARMRQIIADSAREGQAEDPILVEPFLLGLDTLDIPTTFEAAFLMNGIQHRYGFSADSSRIVSEWLYRMGSVRELTLFTRDEKAIKVSAAFSEGKGIETRTRGNALFLSVVAQFNGEVANQVRDWFVGNCRIITGLDDRSYLPLTMERLEDDKTRVLIERMVRGLDLDIQGLAVAVPDGEEFTASFGKSHKTSLEAVSGKNKALFTIHTLRGESGAPALSNRFHADYMESEGTKKLIALAGPLVDALAKGAVLFMDEFDARLHPLITSALVRLFHSEETNPKGAQLICVTQDTNLLDRHLFRRDQIYFVEKDKSSATKLYSLAEFKVEVEGEKRTVRNDASYERDYIQGRYGAIPYLGDIGRLIAESVTEQNDRNAHAHTEETSPALKS